MKINNFTAEIIFLIQSNQHCIQTNKQVACEKEKINSKNMRIKKGSFMYYQLNMQNSRCICRFFSKQRIFIYGVNYFFKKLTSSLILANSFSESDSVSCISYIYIYISYKTVCYDTVD